MAQSARYSSSAARWRAVQQRDSAADGTFVYAVGTTRIYCRPNCRARLARRANVVFFDAPAAAEQAGFRACKRCRPQSDGGQPADPTVVQIQALLARLAGGGDEDGHGDVARTATSLAADAGVSRWHFARRFREVAGMTPGAYLREEENRRRRRREETKTDETRTDMITNEMDKTEMNGADTKNTDWLQPDDTLPHLFGED